jgi:glycosyltransferase involved in cell wall biosynthesis
MKEKLRPLRSALKARLCIHIPSYNARGFLLAAVRRVPWDMLQGFSTTVLFVDNASQDDTSVEIGKARSELSAAGITTHAILHPENRGYGGSVKSAFTYSIENGFDFMAIVHSDGQYAPEELPRLLAALADDADICLLFGSRLAGSPLEGGMPVYKYLANRFLTGLQNLCSGLHLSEYHSGYRLYRLALLAKIPWQTLSDGFVFDNEIIFAIQRCGLRIAELPIPTHYGTEKSNVPTIGTPFAILVNLAQYMLCRAGLRDDPRYRQQHQ